VKGVAQSGINLEDVRNLPTPVPSLEQQNQVVCTLKAAGARTRIALHEQVRARQLFDHLERSILTRAFRGELVPQDPADEPALVALSRSPTEISKPTRGRKRQAA
jgi:type I restriction enzyme S subunit